MANLLGQKDLARIVSKIVAHNVRAHPADWASIRALEHGVSRTSPHEDVVALFEELLSSSTFVPASDILEVSNEAGGCLNVAKFGPSSFYETNETSVEQQVVDICQQVNWLKLQDAVDTSVRLLDSAFNAHPTRPLALGVFGLAELLFRLGIPYGDNPFCLLFLDELFFYIAFWAYKTSVELARERGSYQNCNNKQAAAHPFVTRLQQGINARGLNYPLTGEVVKYGIRNVSLLGHSSAGFPGFTCGTSSGIDVFPQLSWVHKGAVGECVETASIASDYLEFSESRLRVSAFPDYFVTAATVSQQDTLRVHSVVQYWSDRALVDRHTSDSPALDITDWIPTNPPELETIDPSVVEQLPTQDVIVKNCSLTQGDPGLVLNLTLEIRNPETKKYQPLKTIPAVLPPAYDYQVQRSTIPAAPGRKKSNAPK